MELAIPLIAMAGLYIASNKHKSTSDYNSDEEYDEGFTDYKDLPNTNLHNVNYPTEFPVKSQELDNTEQLSHNNKYSGTAYTDKYFEKPHPKDIHDPKKWNNVGGKSSVTPTDESKFKSLNGDYVAEDYFSHNNMVPFFGRKNTGRDFKADENEGLMDNYLGKGSQQIEKQEQAPLFAPNDNYQWAHGTPNQSDFMQSRVNQGMKMSNVLPFKQETVGPGIGLGYNTEGSEGYNSGMLNREAWMPKNIDELRTNNHSKASGVALYGHEGPAISGITEMGSIGTMEKNRVERSFEMGPERLMTTTGAEKGNTLRPIQEDRYTNRQDTTSDYSGVATSQNPGMFVDGEYMPSTRTNLGAVPISAAASVGKGNITNKDYGANSQVSHMNNRSANHQVDYFGAVGGAIGSVISPLLDILRPSRKENTVGTLRPYQNPGSKVSQTYIFNPSDRPGPTIRETTENSKFHLNTGTGEMNKGGYTVTDVKPITNNRMNQSDHFYSGNASACDGTREVRPYDAEYRQRNNDIKSSTIDGRLIKGNMSMMNNHINMNTGDRTDKLSNKRAPAPVIATQSPGLDTMGRLQGKNELYNGMQADRSQGDILSALKKNPYALSIV
jgi:hypothetical protein